MRGRVQTPDGKPFANAIARVLGSGSVVRSDSSGVFRITDAAAGTQTVEVRAVGFEPQRHLVQLTPNEPYALTVAIDRSRVMLDTVRVVAGRPLPPDVQRIETRWRRGLGTFLDGNTVRERSTNFLTSALWGIPGVRLGMRAGFGNTIYLRAGGGGECIPVIYLDGFRFIASGISIDEMVAPDDVAAIEMYVRAMQRPAEFTDLSDCGVFVVWTSDSWATCRCSIRAESANFAVCRIRPSFTKAPSCLATCTWPPTRVCGPPLSFVVISSASRLARARTCRTVPWCTPTRASPR